MSKAKKAPSKKRSVVAPVSAVKLVKPDFRAQLKEIWGERVFSAAEVKAMRDAELEGEDG